LVSVNGKIFAIDAPGIPNQLYQVPGTHSMEGIGHFTETVFIYDSSGVQVGTPYSIQWGSSIYIEQNNGQWKFTGSIGPR